MKLPRAKMSFATNSEMSAPSTHVFSGEKNIEYRVTVSYVVEEASLGQL